MCIIKIKPLFRLTSQKHSYQRNQNSPEPFRETAEKMQHTNHTSTVPAGVFINPICAPIFIQAATTATAEFVDHYEVMGLDRWATTEEIKTAHRNLRSEYFRTNAKKYAALQAAYAVLVNWEARRDYDVVYRLRLGLPPPPPTHCPEPTLPSQAPNPPTQKFRVSDAVNEIDVRERQSAGKRKQDPNWALKHYQPICRPVLGMRPYMSFVPVLEAYEGREMHAQLKCGRPKYFGGIAEFARPA
jgi:hypothetical protein